MLENRPARSLGNQVLHRSIYLGILVACSSACGSDNGASPERQLVSTDPTGASTTAASGATGSSTSSPATAGTTPQAGNTDANADSTTTSGTTTNTTGMVSGTGTSAGTSSDATTTTNTATSGTQSAGTTGGGGTAADQGTSSDSTARGSSTADTTSDTTDANTDSTEDTTSTTGTQSTGTVSGCGADVSVNRYPFGCDFAWGANGNNGNRSSYLDFITTWIGYEPFNNRDGQCDGCGLVGDLQDSSAMAIYYAYFAGYALPDCNTAPQGPNLCTDGARWLRENRSDYLRYYSEYAQKTYAASPDKPVVWLLEGDFVQYTYDDQNQPFSMQELGDLAREVVCAIKSNAPNAIVAMNHSAWLADDVTNDFWDAMPTELLDMVWTTGVGNNGGFINGDANSATYNADTATYAFLHQKTGLPVWVDTSFGLSQQDDSWSGIGASELNQRISEGVIAANITEPPGDYQSRVSSVSEQLDQVCQ